MLCRYGCSGHICLLANGIKIMIKRLLIAFLYGVIQLSAMNRPLALVYSEEFSTNFAQEDEKIQHMITAAQHDIAARRMIKNIKPLNNGFFEYKFNNGYRLYFAYAQETVAMLGFEYKKNNNKQTRYIKRLSNIFTSMQQFSGVNNQRKS